jgi:cyclase
LERRDVDELLLLDVGAGPSGRGPDFELVSDLCSMMFCPVTVGGGVRSLDDIRELLRCGADKVSIRTARHLVSEASRKFGAQAIVVDVRSVDEAKAVQGAGELLLQSVERDGMMCGYDLDLIRDVSSAVDIPVIAAGGCGSYEDMRQAIEAGAHAVAVGAAFQFCEITPKGAARYLNEHGIAARV